MTRQTRPLVARVHHLLEHPGYLPAVFLLAFLNALLPFIAIEIFLIARVWVRPRRWALAALFVAGGAALGAFAVSQAIGSDGAHSALGSWLIAKMQGPAWDRAAAVIRQYGAIGLGMISLSFIPQQPAIVVAALAGLPWYAIALPILIARGLKYGFWCAVAVYAPHWLTRIESVRRSLPEQRGRGQGPER